MSAKHLRLHHRLQMAAQTIKKAADHHLLQTTGISTAQAAVLAIISEQDRASQRYLAQTLNLNESAVTAMVERLMKQGLLSRQRSTDDGRVWQLALSDLGRQRVRQANSAFSLINRQIESVLTPEQIEGMAEGLDALVESFSAR